MLPNDVFRESFTNSNDHHLYYGIIIQIKSYGACRNMNKNSIANLSFIICAVILLNNFTALLVNTEISKTTFNMSIVLMIVLLINGISLKRRAR